MLWRSCLSSIVSVRHRAARSAPRAPKDIFPCALIRLLAHLTSSLKIAASNKAKFAPLSNGYRK